METNISWNAVLLFWSVIVFLMQIIFGVIAYHWKQSFEANRKENEKISHHLDYLQSSVKNELEQRVNVKYCQLQHEQFDKLTQGFVLSSEYKVTMNNIFDKLRDNHDLLSSSDARLKEVEKILYHISKELRMNGEHGGKHK